MLVTSKKIQRIYKYKAVSSNCRHATFYQGISDNYSFAQFGKVKVDIQKGKGLVQMNLWLFLFSAYPVLPSRLRKCLNIAKSGISTVVNPVDQRGVWVFFFPRGN